MAVLCYPLRHIFITQSWGVNPTTYARFGLLGHSGVDLRLFSEDGVRQTTAILYAPHAGKVLEARNDPNGYGLYLKIENDKEGSILGHLKSFSVKVGDTVARAQKIGVCNNTGFSTGAHLHWGYYPLPRDKSNGYSGTIDQLKHRTIITLQQAETEGGGSDMAGITHAWAQTTSDAHLRSMLIEHLGEHNGKLDWGASEGNRGGHLGAERRKNTSLSADLAHARNMIATLEQEPKHLRDSISALMTEIRHKEDQIQALTEKIKQMENAQPPAQEPKLPENAKLNGITRSYTQGAYTVTENYEVK